MLFLSDSGTLEEHRRSLSKDDLECEDYPIVGAHDIYESLKKMKTSLKMKNEAHQSTRYVV